MPPRNFASRSLRNVSSESYVCPSCLLKATPRSAPAKHPPRTRPHTRSYTTALQQPFRTHSALRDDKRRRYTTNGSLASSTAVNAPSTVPKQLRDLHEQLQLLQDKAISYIDRSRLQLALRSLESSEPISRIAFLGIGSNGVRAVRRLIKVLLADELGDEAPWERSLLSDDDPRSIMIRYGEPGYDVGVKGSSSPLLQDVRIPSPKLKSWNVEILVTGLSTGGYTPSNSADSTKAFEDSILVPPVTISNSSGGRPGFVRYPVHKALVLADGVSGVVEFGRLSALLADSKLINAALSLPLQANSISTMTESGHASAVSISLAEQALDLFRSSNANGAIYNEQWQQSRVGTISTWLAAASQQIGGQPGLSLAVSDMIQSLLLRTKNEISAAEESSTPAAIPEAKRSNLQSAVATWSEEAHRDLQVNLTTALSSQSWRRTTWWRLFWRIDEVSMSAGDILRRGWLVEAEQSLAFLSGRVLEAGFASRAELRGRPQIIHERVGKDGENLVEDHKAAESPEAPLNKPAFAPAELVQLSPTIVHVEEQSGLNAHFDPPWPQTIKLARQQMLHQQVPAMHQKAQALMLASLSTIGGSGALAGWLWVVSGGVALYEAGAIASLGLVWALRRLQKKWSHERESFTEAAREHARRVLADVERNLKQMVNEGGQVRVREEDRRDWREARAAVKACEEAKAKIE